MPSTDEIFADAQARRSEMQAIETALDNQIRKIDKKLHPGKDLTDAEREALGNEQDTLRDGIIDLNVQMERLAYITLEKLDSAADLRDLCNRVDKVIAGLGKINGKIKKYAAIATKVTSVLTGVAKLKDDLAGLGIGGQDGNA
ncbi:MAG: hypothetical protein ABWY00_10235 [Dongiaceae bacterium]